LRQRQRLTTLVMGHQWNLAARSFAHGRVAAADKYLTRAAVSAPLPFAAPLFSAALTANRAAIDVSRSTDSASSTFSAAETAASSARAYAARCTDPDPAVRAFASETALTASYNSALAAMRARQPEKARYSADRGVEEALRSVQVFADFGIGEAPGAFQPKKRPRTSARSTADGAVHLSHLEQQLQYGQQKQHQRKQQRRLSEKYQSQLLRARGACEALRIAGFVDVGTEVAIAVQRWARAAAAVFELSAAFYVLEKETALALDVVHVSESFASLAASLASFHSQVRDNRWNPLSGEAMDIDNADSRDGIGAADGDEDGEEINEDEYDDGDEGGDGNDNVDNDGNNDRDADDAGLRNGSDIDGKDVKGGCRKHSHNLHSARRVGCSTVQEVTGDRGRCITAVAHSLVGEWDNALAAVRDAGNAALNEQDVAALNRICGDFCADECHWPSVYAAGAIMLRRGETSDVGSAIAMLERCSAAGYRAADATALAARLGSGENALCRWQRVMALDYIRPGALWTASRVFARVGRHGARASLLECLEELLVDIVNSPKSAVSTGRDGRMVSIAPKKLKTNSGSVSAERARALAASGNWIDALKVLNRVVVEGECAGVCKPNEGNDDKFCGGESARCDGAHGCGLHGLLRDHAWVLACAQELDKAVNAAHCAASAASNGYDRCAALLAKADALLNGEDVNFALKAVRESFREAELGTSSSGWKEDDGAVRFLRGTCYNNLGVLEACMGEYQRADRSFSAAQIAFDKCVEGEAQSGWTGELVRTALIHGDAAVFNRCLVLWRRSASAEATAAWLARIGSRGDGYSVDVGPGIAALEVGAAHVLGGLSKKQRQAMVEVCSRLAEVDALRDMAQRELQPLVDRSLI
jgi:hypothetical protein